MFNQNMIIFLYKVIGSVIHSFIDNFFDYMVILQHKLSDYEKKFKIKNFNDLSGLGVEICLIMH